MLFISRLFAGLLLLFCILGILGQVLPGGDGYLRAIQTTPLVYLFWVVWQSLKPIESGLFKFTLAHLGPGLVIVIGLIPAFAPNKILGFVIGGIGLSCVGVLLIHQMHVQRRVIRAAH